MTWRGMFTAMGMSIVGLVAATLLVASLPKATAVTIRPLLVSSTVGTATSPAGADTFGPVTVTGCPPPQRPPKAAGPAGPPPARPKVVVAESALPDPPPPSPRLRSLGALAGKGMWIWQPAKTEAGSAEAIVQKAEKAGLTQLWVRVGDSLDGFYAAGFLDGLVPVAHRHGVSVIGWGFPYLYDPVADAGWSAAAMAWQAPGGGRLDGFSADIETASEGTMLSSRRATVYLGLVRAHVDGRPLIATVYQPTDYWLSVYPYRALAPYVDAMAPMVYWSCREPGAAASSAATRLQSLAPVLPIGQAFDLGPSGGRVGPPTGAEISRFLDSARQSGALGASFWVWEDMTAGEWDALAAYPWYPRPRGGTVLAGAYH